MYQHLTRAALFVCTVINLTGCVLSTVDTGSDSDWETSTASGDDSTGETEDVPSVYDNYPVLSAPCHIEPAEVTELLVTTTDFATGGLSTVDLATLAVTPDVALTSTDAIARAHNGKVYVVNRYLYDNVDVLDPAASWQSGGQYSLTLPGYQSVNPHTLEFAYDDPNRGYAVLFGAPTIAVLDFSRPPAEAVIGDIPLQRLADADGIPEASAGIVCGDTLFVSVQRLDRNAGWVPVDHDYIAAIDLQSQRVIELFDDPSAVPGIALRGQWARQFRNDPTDLNGHTALVLTTGIERVDLATGEVEWAVTPQQFADAGILGSMYPQAFDLDAAGTRAFVAAYRPDYSAVDIYQVTLDDPAAAVVQVAGGYLSAERTLEVVGDRLYFGDTSPGQSGLRVFDIADNGALTPADIGATQPLSLGLAPYRVQASAS